MQKLKRNQSGFSHHFILMFIVVVAVAAFGAWQVYRTNALVNPVYVMAVQTQEGCILSGRPWDSTANDCLSTCRVNQGSYLHITGSDGISRGYCGAAITEVITASDCVNQYHRFYVKEIGCARRANQDVNKDNARQCIPAYPRYMATVNPDVCVATSSAPPTVRVASFNILGASKTVPPDPRATSIGPYTSRMAAAFRVITGQKIDVVGIQEMEAVQRSLFVTDYSANYGIFPATADYATDNASGKSIIWNKARFSFVSGSVYPYTYNLNNLSATQDFPVVLLKDLKTGNTIAFGNIHLPSGSSYTSGQYRYLDAKIERSTEQAWTDQGYPMIFTGDHNSQGEVRPPDTAFAGSDRSKIPYCVLGATGNMAHAYDLLFNRNKPDGTCPPDNLLLKIDQIWANVDSKVTNYYPFTSSDVTSATDHQYVPYADIVPEAPSP